ncbi:hypothetical protein M8494_04730 [Serratia ureilytica]
MCPVQATFQREDGSWWSTTNAAWVALHCVQACPYDARFINHATQTADKCTFCVHRLEADCCRHAESCVWWGADHRRYARSAQHAEQAAGWRHVEIKVLAGEPTAPHVFYLGLDDASSRRCRGGRRFYGERDDEPPTDDRRGLSQPQAVSLAAGPCNISSLSAEPAPAPRWPAWRWRGGDNAAHLERAALFIGLTCAITAPLARPPIRIKPPVSGIFTPTRRPAVDAVGARCSCRCLPCDRPQVYRD